MRDFLQISIFKDNDLSIRDVDSYVVRGLFILPLGAFGILHFILPSLFEKMVPSYAGDSTFWVYFSGAALTAASIFIFAKWVPKLANFLLILFVLTFIVTVDIPSIIYKTGIEREYFIISLMKDTSLLGGSLFYFFISRMRKRY